MIRHISSCTAMIIRGGSLSNIAYIVAMLDFIICAALHTAIAHFIAPEHSFTSSYSLLIICIFPVIQIALGGYDYDIIFHKKRAVFTILICSILDLITRLILVSYTSSAIISEVVPAVFITPILIAITRILVRFMLCHLSFTIIIDDSYSDPHSMEYRKLRSYISWLLPKACITESSSLRHDNSNSNNKATIYISSEPNTFSSNIQYRYDLGRLYEKIFKSIILHDIKDSPEISSSYNALNRVIKRIYDIILAIILIILCIPILIIIAICIYIEDSGPIFYTQQRLGAYGIPFTILKLRSMYNYSENNGEQWAVHNDPRATKVGVFIRKFRLDELPQLFNILIGDMSFVGPRPERPFFASQLQKHINHYNARHIVKPGLTGWAQIHHHYCYSLYDAKQRHALDMYYIKYFSLYMDILVMMKTIRIFFTSRI